MPREAPAQRWYEHLLSPRSKLSLAFRRALQNFVSKAAMFNRINLPAALFCSESRELMGADTVEIGWALARRVDRNPLHGPDGLSELSIDLETGRGRETRIAA